MVRSHVLRQRVRKGLLILSFLLFPITMNYFSPYVIIDGASQGTINGSLVAFALMFMGALFFGRLWCGWACPAGGLGEIAFDINDKKVNGKKIDLDQMGHMGAMAGHHRGFGHIRQRLPCH